MGCILAQLSAWNNLSAEVAAIDDLEQEADRFARGLAPEAEPDAVRLVKPVASVEGERHQQLPLLVTD